MSQEKKMFEIRDERGTLMEDWSSTGSLYRGDRLPGYGGEKLQSKFNPEEEEKQTEGDAGRDERVKDNREVTAMRGKKDESCGVMIKGRGGQ